MRRPTRRLLLAAPLATVLLLAAGAGGAALFVRGSLPALDGSVRLTGLSAEATVARDSLGVPLITAASRADAARALGFVHAQERFFQMDLLRRAAAGELAALLGADLVPVDQRHRPHGFRPTARAAVEALPPAHRAVLSAYAEGVNAGLEALGARPWEYGVLRQAPAPWREEDSFLAAAAMFIDLQLDAMREEAQYAALNATLPPALVALLLPQGDEWDAPLDGGEAPPLRVPTPDELGGFRPGPAPAGLRAADSPAAGSNAWAVAGQRTASGSALLAGDMHLGLRLPHIWFRAALTYPAADGTPRRIVGVTLPGTPLVVVGSTGRVAWSFTNSYGDYIDLVRLEFARPRVVRTASGEVPLDTLRETIAVAGGDPVALEVVRSPFGPVLLTGHDGAPLAVQWAAHQPEAFNLALLDLEEAATVEDALALGPLLGVPAQNFNLADASGAVGWTIAGRVPRRAGRNGQRPVASTDPDARWGGWLSPDETPRLTAPPDGLIWTANNRIVSGDALARIGLGPYAHGARARQIRDGLRALPAVTEADMLALQLDDRALLLARWRALLLRTLDAPGAQDAPRRAELRAAVAAWDGRAGPEGSGNLLVRAFRERAVAAALLPLTAPARRALGDTVVVATEPAAWLLATAQPPHLLPEGFASWQDLLLAAADAAAEECPGRLDACSWAGANRLAMRHPFAGVLPGVGGALSMPEAPQPGDARVPRVSGRSFGASQRLVVSPGREGQGILHMPGGQAGHPLSPYWGAGHSDWAEGHPSPLLPGRPRWTLRLTPG